MTSDQLTVVWWVISDDIRPADCFMVSYMRWHRPADCFMVSYIQGWYSLCVFCCYLPWRRRPGTGDIATPPRPYVCPSVRPSVCLSVTFSFRTVTQKRIDIDGMLFEFFMNFLNIDFFFFQYFKFSSRFKLFPTLQKKKNGVKKIFRGGGGWIFV